MEIPIIDIFWVLLSAALVFLMQGGFLCLETGLTRSKNNINVAIKNLTDVGVSIILFWAFGFALMFGSSWQGVFGNSYFFLDFSETGVWLVVFFLFQVMFCGTTVTILSGAIAERMRFDGYIFLAILISGFVYPMFGHWAWNGLEIGQTNGWLGQLGFVDFAGSTVVHSVGGWAALATILIIGPRMGRFPEDGPPQRISGANLPVAVLGVILLWLGWFGFNGGSTLAMNEQVPHIIANTVLAGGAGLVGALAFGWFLTKRAEVVLSINGSLAGLVAITANAHVVSSPSAVTIGLIGGIVMLFTERLLEYFRIDDAVGAIPVHLGAGIWGTLAVAIFGKPELLGTGLVTSMQLIAQLTGIVICGIWTMSVTYMVLWIINRWMPLRVTASAEHIGLNVSEHGATTEILDLFRVMDEQSRTGDLSLRVPVEPFTEVGQIAERYNQVMESLANMTAKSESMERLNDLKDEFLANTSHELRTPLNGIIGITESLIDGATGPLTKSQKHNMAMVVSSGRRLATLIDDILDFSKLKHQALTLQIKPLYLAPLVEFVLALSEPLIQTKLVKLINNISHDLPPVYGDENRIQQILHNLVGNAIKFTDAGRVIVSAQVIDNFIEIMIEDTGIGISTDKLEQIFQPFEQADGSISRKFGGTGIGLTVTQKLVALHGGEITVTSTPNEGSLFTFTLPIADEIPEMSSSFMTPQQQAVIKLVDDEPVIKPVETDDDKQPSILVVDDEPVNRQVLINQLQLQNYFVVEAHDGLEALKLIYGQEQQQFDLVILDVMMPRMSGYEVCQSIRRHHSAAELPVIMITAKYQLSSLVEGFEAGANDYIIKPFSKAELLLRIRTHIQLNNLRALNAMKDKFFSIVAHDLRGPFSPLLGMSELLTTIASTSPPEHIQELSDSIHRSAKTVFSLLENLLDWSRLQGGRMPYKPTQIDLQDLANDITELFDHNAKQKQVHLVNQIPTSVLVEADHNMLNTVLRNLVSNALKFTPIGGQVTIKAELKQGAVAMDNQDFLLPTLPDPPAFVEVAVIDTGEGISPENQKKLFNLNTNHTTLGTSKEKGTGLGLLMCKEMVERNGGHIKIESEVGQGTTVKFTVPAALNASEIGDSVGENESSATQTSHNKPFIALPPEQLQKLLKMAQIGDMNGIKKQATHLSELSEQFIPFATKLYALAKSFEEEAILTLVEEHVPSS